MWIISFACLVFVAFMCVVGTLSRTYDDNLFQRLGMALFCFGALARANEVMHAQAVPAELLLGHIGLAVFAMGTTFKVVIRRIEQKARATLWPTDQELRPIEPSMFGRSSDLKKSHP